MKKIKIKEKDVMKSIIEWLGWKKLFFWRNQAGGIVGSYKGKNWFVKLGMEGSADIFILKEGQLFGVEVKGSEGKQSEKQEKFQKEFEKNGGKYLIVRGIEDIENYNLF